MKNLLKTILKTLSILLLSTIVGFLLLVGSYMLPTEKVYNNISFTSKQYSQEGPFNSIVSGNDATMIDTSSDGLMLMELIYDGDESVLEKAVLVKHYETLDDQGDYGFINILDSLMEKGTSETKVTEYSRYWHGYLVFLKPLFMFFNHNQLKMLNIVIQTFLVFIIINLMNKKGLGKYSLAFGLSWLLINPFIIGQVFHYSSVFYITLVSIIFILIFNEKIKEKNWYIYVFLLIGIFTSYLDLLTCPLVTLGVPLLFYYLLNSEDDFKTMFINLVKLVIFWVIGFLAFWAMKFVVGYIVTGRDLFTDAINQTVYRMSGDGFSTYDAIEHNVHMIVNRYGLAALAFYLVTFIIRTITNKDKFCFKQLLKNVLLFVFALAPFIWYCLVVNHSFIHYWFTYRNLIITIFALLILLEKSFITTNKNA